MTAGNASNTVFTAIHVGEDFYMSFSTERFFHNINSADIVNVVFKLYDARIIGDIGSPNPNAIIETVTRSTTPTRFSVSTTTLSVLIYSNTLDAYSATASVNPGPVFRGELYGYAEVTVGGEETGAITRLIPTNITAGLSVTGDLPMDEPYWDGYFYSTTVNKIICGLSATGNLTKL